MRSPTLTAATLLLAAATAAGAQEPAPAPCSTAEHRQFDFWIGEWEVETPAGQKAGRNTIPAILGGCALEEQWRGAGGSTGKSLNMYYARDRRWHQSWVDGNGGRLDLAGGLDDSGRMVLSGEMPGRDGGRELHEVSWQPLDGGRVRQHWRASRDAGATWQEVFVGVYIPRREPTPAGGG